MATNAIALTTWSIEYYEAMAAAERVRLQVTTKVGCGVGPISQLVLWIPFRLATHGTEKLISSLNDLEALPSSILLEREAEKIPDELRELFRTMCDVLQKSEAEGLHKSVLLGGYIERLGKLSQQVSGFADRYQDAQKKLRSSVSTEEAVHYREAFEAYRSCKPASEQAADEDVKREILHF